MSAINYTRIPNSTPYESASQIETYSVETARGELVIMINTASVALVGGSIEQQIEAFAEHHARIATREAAAL